MEFREQQDAKLPDSLRIRIQEAIYLECYVIRYSKEIIETMMNQWERYQVFTSMMFLLIDLDWLFYPKHDYDSFSLQLHEVLANEKEIGAIRRVVVKNGVLKKMISILRIFDILFASVRRLHDFCFVGRADFQSEWIAKIHPPRIDMISDFEKRYHRVQKRALQMPLPYGAFKELNIQSVVATWMQSCKHTVIGFFDMMRDK